VICDTFPEQLGSVNYILGFIPISSVANSDTPRLVSQVTKATFAQTQPGRFASCRAFGLAFKEIDEVAGGNAQHRVCDASLHGIHHVEHTNLEPEPGTLRALI
jgi:hypothetical protein